MTKKLSLRKCINEKCKSCIYDPKASGTWLQQVTICSVSDCALYTARPKSKAPIPESVLDYYLVPKAERRFYRCSRPLEGCFSGHKDDAGCGSEGALNSVIENHPNSGDSR